ncbi:hypothetical protein ACMSWU_002137 [Cronobacter turicensis]
MKKLTLIAVFLLSACASSSKTYGPDGRVAYSLTCSGIARDWGMCLSKAGDICGAQGYDVLSVNGDSGAVITANPQSAFGGTTISRNMLVSCK